MHDSGSPQRTWTNKYTVHSYEVDTNAILTMPAICKFMQETAWQHAENLGVGFSLFKEQNMAWVLSQQRIKMNTWPQWGDKIIITTWPSEKKRLAFFRDFKFTDENSNIIGYAITRWYALNVIRKRPQDVDHTFDYTNALRERTFDELTKLTTLKSAEQRYQHRVEYGDLDVNGHVNNAKYVSWLLESHNLEFLKSKKVEELEIQYISETFHDEKIQVYINNEDTDEYYYNIIRLSDEKEIARARVLWKPLS